ncbi:class I SAM-dependent methyltransferase [Candidatus Kaiserbacteria bacterium]|nr:class I SAM-dependent methyltransferase [Candidatus Kaiserbacteria bacterium]
MKGIEHLKDPQYSEEFLNLISTDEKVKELLEGSCVFSGDFNRRDSLRDWERGRKFIAQAISKDGTILDYGSANGFLLRCLQEWSKLRLNPYGVENDLERLAQAKALFPQLASHFVTPDEIKRQDFPKSFDQVYWAVGDNVNFREEEFQSWLAEVKALVAEGGRFILGFYDTKEENRKKIKNLEDLGIRFSNVLENPNGGNEIIAWIDTQDW